MIVARYIQSIPADGAENLARRISLLPSVQDMLPSLLPIEDSWVDQ
jgi:hypothetical protein